MGRVTNPVADGSRGRPEARNESAFLGQNVVPMQITPTRVAVLWRGVGSVARRFHHSFGG